MRERFWAKNALLGPLRNKIGMKRLTPLLIFLVLFILGAIYLPGFTKYLRLRHKESELQHEIDTLRTEIAKLNQEGRLLKTDLTRLEEVVREELGLVKPGETVIKVVEEEAPQPSETTSSAKPSKTVH